MPCTTYVRQAKMPPAISDRDLVQLATVRQDDATGAWYTMYKNAEHPSRPPQSGIVRCVYVCACVSVHCMCVCLCL